MSTVTSTKLSVGEHAVPLGTEFVGADHLGLQVSRGAIDYLLNRLYSRQGRGLLGAFGNPDARHLVDEVRFAADRFFMDVLAWHLRQPRGTGRLEREGLLHRCSCDHDARGAYACLTDCGRERLEQARATHGAVVREHFLSRFSEGELGAMVKMCERISPCAGPASSCAGT